jgi:energy-coupling factor transporter transmembrane protein EcfT
LPIIGGVAALGISSFLLNPIVIIILAFVFLFAGVVIYKWRKSKGLSCLKPGCKCNSCAIQ